MSLLVSNHAGCRITGRENEELAEKRRHAGAQQYWYLPLLHRQAESAEHLAPGNPRSSSESNIHLSSEGSEDTQHRERQGGRPGPLNEAVAEPGRQKIPGQQEG